MQGAPYPLRHRSVKRAGDSTCALPNEPAFVRRELRAAWERRLERERCTAQLVGCKAKSSGSHTHSTLSEVSLPERSGKLDEDQAGGQEHEPIADGMGLAKIMEGKPIDRQQQKTGGQHQ